MKSHFIRTRLKYDRKSKTYKIIVRTRTGRFHRIDTHQHEKKEAVKVVQEAKIEQLEHAAAVGKLTNEAVNFLKAEPEITLSQALERWLEWLRIRHRSSTAFDYETTVKAWLYGADIAKESPSIIQDKHVYDWVNDTDWKAKENTRRTKLAAIKSFCQFCYQEGYMARDPSARVFISSDKLTHAQKEVGVHSVFTEDQIQSLLAAFRPGDFWFVAICLARYAGLRLGDVCRLEWQSLTSPGVLKVWTHKRHKEVKVPIHPRLKQALDALPKPQINYVFPTEQEIISDPRRRADMSKTFGRICQRLGMKGKCFHDLRRTYCTEMARLGVPTSDISRMVGHSNGSTTEHYIQKA